MLTLTRATQARSSTLRTCRRRAADRSPAHCSATCAHRCLRSASLSASLIVAAFSSAVVLGHALHAGAPGLPSRPSSRIRMCLTLAAGANSSESGLEGGGGQVVRRPPPTLHPTRSTPPSHCGSRFASSSGSTAFPILHAPALHPLSSPISPFRLTHHLSRLSIHLTPTPLPHGPGGACKSAAPRRASGKSSCTAVRQPHRKERQAFLLQNSAEAGAEAGG